MTNARELADKLNAISRIEHARYYDVSRSDGDIDLSQLAFDAAAELRRWADAESEVDLWKTRTFAAMRLIPEDVTVGDLRTVEAELRAERDAALSRAERLEKENRRHVEMHERMAERLDIRQDEDGSIHDEIDRLTAAAHNAEFDNERLTERAEAAETELAIERERVAGLLNAMEVPSPHTAQLEARVEQLRWALKGIFLHFEPEHLDHVSNSACGTNAARALQETGMNDVIKQIAAERQRQISEEGWTLKHDDRHTDGELAKAAACYTAHAASEDYDPKAPCPRWWPWHWRWWKPKDPRRDLIRAAALIVAEIERLDRRALQGAGDE